MMRKSGSSLLKGMRGTWWDTFLEGAPSIEVAAFEGYHIEELKQLIVSQIDDALLKNNAEELFRLPIDRVFTIQGIRHSHYRYGEGTIPEGR